MVWGVDGPQCRGARQNRDGNVQPHSQKRGIERQASPGFTTAVFDSLEVPEALHCCMSSLVWRHSIFNVGSRPHFDMKTQFRLNFACNLVGTSHGMNKTYCRFDLGHHLSLFQTACSALMVAPA